MQNHNILNFRIPDPLKDEFQTACRALRTSMTAELNRMIRKFIQEEAETIDQFRPVNWLSSNDWTQR